MSIGKLAVVVVAVGIAIGATGAAVAAAVGGSGDPGAGSAVQSHPDIDVRKNDGPDEIAVLDDDEGDEDSTRGDDGTSGGDNTGDRDLTAGNDGTTGGDNTVHIGSGNGDDTGDGDTSGGATTG